MAAPLISVEVAYEKLQQVAEGTMRIYEMMAANGMTSDFDRVLFSVALNMKMPLLCN